MKTYKYRKTLFIAIGLLILGLVSGLIAGNISQVGVVGVEIIFIFISLFSLLGTVILSGILIGTEVDEELRQ